MRIALLEDEHEQAQHIQSILSEKDITVTARPANRFSVPFCTAVMI